MHRTASDRSPSLLRATLSAIARLEARGDKPARLTDPSLERWAQFRRKLGWWDLIALLHADAAQQYPVPFDLSRWPTPPTSLSEPEAEALVRECATAPTAEPLDWLRAQAANMGLAGGALSEAPKFQSTHRVLCLPGTGGRVAAFQCLREVSLDLGAQFTWAIDSTAEHVAIGLAAVETKARVNFDRLTTPDALDAAALARFDRVVGLKATPPAPGLAESLGDRGKWI